MRSLFLLDPDLVFLNHGSFGACPKVVLETQVQWQIEMERNPVAFLGRRSAALLADVRATLARHVGAAPQDLVLIPNATTGVNLVARSFPLAAGDEVLSTNLEYGACDAIWQQVCAQRGARYQRVSIPLPYRPEEVVDRLMAAVTPRTRLIFLSHLTSATALILPVAAICRAARARGIACVIDGAHAPGQMELDLSTLGADFYVGNAHKWLCAPKGSGFLHVAPAWQSEVQATVLSWGYADGVAGVPAFEAFLGDTPFLRRLQWQGTRDLAAFLSIPAALAFQAAQDWPAVRQRCHALAQDVQAELCARYGLEPIASDADWVQMVAIPVPPQDPEALRERLYRESGIEVAVTRHEQKIFLRVSVQGYNTAEEMARLLAAPALA